MNAQYKLIKTYPNSPAKGTIVTLSFKDGVKHYVDESKNQYSASTVEDFNDFWQLYKREDEYQILRLSDGFNTFYRQSNGKFTINTQYEYEEKTLLDKGLTIISVKRLSDGAIFSIGDTISHKYDPSLKRKIQSIHNNMLLPTGTISFNGSSIRLSNAVVIKKEPLFITEDNESIFEENVKLFAVHKKTMKLYENELWNSSISKHYLEARAWFFHKRSAEKYIIFNKPCLSINDIVELLKMKDNSHSNYLAINSDINTLEKFVSSKLKK